MMDAQANRIFRGALNGLLLGIVLFMGGLFVTIWTWGFGLPIGGPMMIAGVAAPFWMILKAQRGEEWSNEVLHESAFKTARELRSEVEALHLHDQSRLLATPV